MKTCKRTYQQPYSSAISEQDLVMDTKSENSILECNYSLNKYILGKCVYSFKNRYESYKNMIYNKSIQMNDKKGNNSKHGPS